MASTPIQPPDNRDEERTTRRQAKRVTLRHPFYGNDLLSLHRGVSILLIGVPVRTQHARGLQRARSRAGTPDARFGAPGRVSRGNQVLAAASSGAPRLHADRHVAAQGDAGGLPARRPRPARRRRCRSRPGPGSHRGVRPQWTRRSRRTHRGRVRAAPAERECAEVRGPDRNSRFPGAFVGSPRAAEDLMTSARRRGPGGRERTARAAVGTAAESDLRPLPLRRPGRTSGNGGAVGGPAPRGPVAPLGDFRVPQSNPGSRSSRRRCRRPAVVTP